MADEQKREKKKENVLKNVYAYFLPTAFRKYKGYFVFRTGKLVINSLQPFLSILLLPKIVEELMGGRDVQRLLSYAAMLVLLEFACAILSGTFGNLVERYGQKFENYYKQVLGKRIMELDFQMTEDKKALDQLELARNGMSWYSGGLNGLMDPLFDIISNAITMVGVTYIIVTKAPVVLLITLITLAASAWTNGRMNKAEQEGYAELSKINRVFGYLGWALADFRYGKEIRLYDSKDMMVEKWAGYTEEMDKRWEDIANKMLPLQLLQTVVNVARDVAVYGYLSVLAIFERISIASCTQMVASASTFSNCLGGIIFSYQNMVKRANYANEFVKFLDYPAAMPKGEKPVKVGMHVFEFRKVSFAYPGSQVQVLKDLNLTIREGEHLSVVGLNGAGKTTMIKLLCRLYDPTEGEILMDGINIKEYDYAQYMGVFAPVFQDFKLFAFAIDENILLKDDFSEEELNRAEETLRKAGVWEKITSLPGGLKTTLFKNFDKDGIEPSGGEQQKLVIARALYKNAPVVILDEPTAALDPIAEYEIYRQFETLVKGKTAIYISHRLSSCQFCDRIAVFSEGSVKEYGTHAELVKRPGGIYAEMFAAQAQYYVTAS